MTRPKPVKTWRVAFTPSRWKAELPRATSFDTNHLERIAEVYHLADFVWMQIFSPHTFSSLQASSTVGTCAALVEHWALEVTGKYPSVFSGHLHLELGIQVGSYNLDYVNVIWCHCKRHHYSMLSRTLFYQGEILRDPPNTSFRRGSLCPQALRQTLWRGYLSHWVYHLTQHQDPTWCPCKEPRSLHPYLHIRGIIEPKPCELCIEVILSIKFANV